MSLELKENSTLYRERKFKKMCQIQNMKVTVRQYSFIFFHIALVSFIVNLVIHVYRFPHVTIVLLIIFITAGCLE